VHATSLFTLLRIRLKSYTKYSKENTNLCIIDFAILYYTNYFFLSVRKEVNKNALLTNSKSAILLIAKEAYLK